MSDEEEISLVEKAVPPALPSRASSGPRPPMPTRGRSAAEGVADAKEAVQRGRAAMSEADEALRAAGCCAPKGPLRQAITDATMKTNAAEKLLKDAKAALKEEKRAAALKAEVDAATAALVAKEFKASLAAYKRALAIANVGEAPALEQAKKACEKAKFIAEYEAGQLCKAASNGDTAEVRMCISCGFSPNDKAEALSGYTPLMRACMKNRFIIVKMLLDDGNADPNTPKDEEEGWTPLHFAAKQGFTESVELLLAHKSDINARLATGETPLKLAKKAGDKGKKAALLIFEAGGVSAATTEMKLAAMQAKEDQKEFIDE